MYKQSYQIADISVDADGTFWVGYLGDQVEQGGMYFGYSRCTSSEDVDALLAILTVQLNKHKTKYIQLIKEEEALEGGEDE